MNNIEQFGQILVQKLVAIDYSPILPAIREVIQTSISYNFEVGGRYGNRNELGGGTKKWTPSKRALKQNGQTLLDTGQLAASIRVNVTFQNGKIFVEMGSNKTYAAVHQFGGLIDRKSRRTVALNRPSTGGPRKFKFKQIRAGKKTYRMPERPYAVVQNADLEMIQKIVTKFIKSYLANLKL